MRKFLVAVFFVLFAPLFVQAAQNIQINWDGQDHSREIVGNNPDKPLAIVGAGSLNAGAINGASLTVNGANISISDSAIANEIYHSVTPDKFEIPTSSDNTRKGAYVAGGAAYNNNVTNNSVSITGNNLTGRDVMGGVALIRQAGDRFGAASANNNSVSISGGAVNSYTFTPTGATSTVLGGNVYGGYTKFSKGSANNNTVSITNGATVQGDVIGGFTDERLTEEDVKTDNVIDTKANGNVVNVTNSALTLNNAGKFFGDTLDLTNLSANKLLPATMPKDQGAIFGGASMTYTRKVNSTPTEEAPEEEKVSIGGTNSDNNTVSLAGGDSVKDVKANVFGGFSAYINEVNYQTKDDSGVITTVKKEGLVTKTTSSDPAAEAQEPEEADQIDDVYSASNNTVILDNVKFNGKVYGGYVYGAELKEQNMLTQNNTVILRNKVELDPTAVIYGGNNGLYEFSTNQLVFDRTIGTFTNKDQFQNFNDWWTINADFKTDLHFDFGVYANMTLDKSTMKEDSKTVVTTVTSTDLTGVHEGDIVYDLVDSGVVLTQKKVGVYSYDLTPTKGSTGNEILWTLTSTKDKANAEVYGQLPLVGLALISEGPEMLTQTLNDLWKSDTEQNTFINGGYHHTRYETGSGFDLDSGLTQAGAWKKFTNDWALGIFAKYAGGSYKTFPIKVTGDANVFGGGLMTSLRYSETGRLEATVEAGYVDAKFESSELLSTFKTKGMYYGASAGFVENPLEDLSLYANFNWKRKASDDITDDLDQKIKFDTLQSMALRFGGDYAFNFVDWKGVIPSIGASAIYEMDGESTVTVEDVKSSEASMKGMSGRGQISLAYHNQDTFLPLHSVLTVYGQVGKREGFGGEVNISFEF